MAHKRDGGPRLGSLTHAVKSRVDAELHREVQEAARREDRSEAAIVRRALRFYLTSYPYGRDHPADRALDDPKGVAV